MKIREKSLNVVSATYDLLWNDSPLFTACSTAVNLELQTKNIATVVEILDDSFEVQWFKGATIRKMVAMAKMAHLE